MKPSLFYSLPVGTILRLKPARAAAYDLPDSLIQFERLTYREGYKTPWIIDSQERAFRPRDFAGIN